ncbi:GspH/FimT family pseudopilin [Lysobacter sp. Root916]|uniref:GspH/FimT family pseudopilin n=1 Tax=Lysobacter sp. Root916 TaxID=1736606 RepID=UPI0009E96044|nr:GspH/FimT family pseudopilin [Lysobacter sp. Root916]
MNRVKGITLIEMLFALTVAAVLIGIAVPGASRAIVRVRMGTVATAMTESFLDSARMAVSTGSAMIVCPAARDGRCEESVDWSQGWVVYADVDGDRRYGQGDPVLLRPQGPVKGLRIYSTQGRRRVVFQSDGGNEGSNVSFSVCSHDGIPVGALVLSNAGRFRVAEADSEPQPHCPQT